MGGGAFVGILAVLGLLAAAAIATNRPDSPQQPPKPPPPPPPPPPPAPSPPALPFPFPKPSPGGWPDFSWPDQSKQLSEPPTTIASDGTKVFRQEVIPALLPMLDKYGVEPVEGDPTRVKLVARTQPNQVSASQWAAAYQKYAIAAVEWLPSTHDPKFLRAIRPEEAKNIAPPSGFYAILTGPMIISMPWPQQGPSMPGPGPMPSPQPSPLDELPPDARAKVDKLLASSNADAMEGAANEIEKQGYAASAEVMRKRAADVRLAASVSNTAAGRTYTVQGKELPSQVAAWYTGDGNRWRELIETNRDLRIRKVGEIEYLTPWKSGMVLVLPTTWNTKKGPMPIQSSNTQATLSATERAMQAFPALSTPPPK